MRPFSCLLLIALPASYALEAGSFKQLNQLIGRQIVVNCPSVDPGPDLCARSCGAGYTQCGSSSFNCYNPGQGDICCSDGTYCTAGNICTDGGCCPQASPLSACGAQSTLATLAPAASSSFTSSSSSAAASSRTSILVAGQTSYANTTFTKTSNSVAVVTSQGIPVETAYSTTTIPLPGGGVTTSTAFTLVYPTPTTTSSSGPVIINNGGVGLEIPRILYGLGWLAMILAMTIIL